MDHHPGRFVDDDNGFVFVNNIKEHFLRYGSRFHRRPFGQDNHIAFF
jgi:hypothetical protein